MIKFIKKNIKINSKFLIKIFFIVLMTVSLCMNIYYYYNLNKSYELSGVYKDVDEETMQGTLTISDGYFLFEGDKYERYKNYKNIDNFQGELKKVDSGEVEHYYKNVYVLKSDNTNQCIYLINDYFYFYDMEGGFVKKYSK